MSNPTNLVLASGSPRRRELLLAAGYHFQVVVPDDSVENSVPSDLCPEAFVVEACFRKARTVAQNSSESLIVAADTVAQVDGLILGKPTDRAHAKQILGLLSGKIHKVLTGVTVWNCSNGKYWTHVEATTLFMIQRSENDLESYLDTQQWVGKAGAFGYQDGLDWVKIIDGLESNVVGLPIELLPGLFKKVTGSDLLGNTPESDHL